jgi:hypothetical protein
MKHLIQISLGLWLVAAVTVLAQPMQPEEKTLRVFDWKEVKLQPRPPGSEIFSTNGVSVLKVENTSNVPLTVTVLTVTDPSLIARADTVSCEMKYNDVGHSLVEKTNSLVPLGGPPGITSAHAFEYTYFPVVSAELALRKYFPPEAAGGDVITNTGRYTLEGTSNWKPYPFSTARMEGSVPYSTGVPRKDLPIKLELKLSLPTNGLVYLRPIKLLEKEHSSTGWWSPQQSGLIGGIGGSLIGCLGGLIGLLISKGKARNFVLAAVKYFIALGILLTATGLVAAVFQQPYDVWYALLLPGVILVLVFSLNLHSIQRRYDELEIRRMTSMDTGS